MALRTYIWNVHEVEVHCPIRHASRDITKIRFHISKLSDFDKKNGENGISAMPRSILRFSIWNLNDPNIYPHIYIRSMMFLTHFLGLAFIGREQPHYCRRLSAPSAIYTSPATCFSTCPLATTVEKITNITRHSHMESWNAWLGRATVKLCWTASTYKYCIPPC